MVRLPIGKIKWLKNWQLDCKLLTIKKLDIYIIKRFLLTFFFILGIIMAIAVIFDVSEKLEDFLKSTATFQQVLVKYYVNFILFYGNMFSPLIIFIAVIFFTAQLANRTEIVAILSAGISFKRLIVPYMVAATFLAFISYYLNNYLIPKANYERITFEDDYLRSYKFYNNRNVHKQIEPGVFIYFDNFNVNRNMGYKFALEKWDGFELKTKIMADFAKWDSTSNKWILENYFVRNINGLNETLEKGSALDTTLALHPSEFSRRIENIQTMDKVELAEFIETERMKGSNLIPFYEIEMHQRTSLPFATYILTLIGVALSSRKVRGGIGFHIALGLLICVSYILAMKVTSVYATNAGLPALAAVWIPNFMFGILSIFLLRSAPK